MSRIESVGLTLTEILSLPQDAIEVLDFNLAEQSPERTSYGVTVFDSAITLAQMGLPGLLQRILALPDEKFQALDFNAAPQHPDHLEFGVSVLYKALALLLRVPPLLVDRISALPNAFYGQSALLNRILALPDEVFANLDFNAAPRNERHPSYGCSVFIQVCKRAQQRDIRILKRFFSLPRHRFKELNLVQPSLAPEVLLAIRSYAEQENEYIVGLDFLCSLSDEFFSQFLSVNNGTERILIAISAHLRGLLGNALEDSNVAVSAMHKVISKIDGIENIHLKNSACVFLAKLIKEKYSYLDAHSVLKAVTPDSPQLYGSACHELAEHYYTAVFDDTDCAEASSDTASLLQKRLSVLLKAVTFAVKAYIWGKTDDRSRLCLRIVLSYWATNEENINYTGEVTILHDDRDKTFMRLLEGGSESSIDAIIEWIKAQREIVELRREVSIEKPRKRFAEAALFSGRARKSQRLSDDDCARSSSPTLD